jgi:drug/metabolite transporter (DMT)-like permease
MLVNIRPILLALLGGCWLLHERFLRWLVAGMAVSFGGVLVVGISESNRGGTSVSGVVLCLVATACYAAGGVCQKLPCAMPRPSRSRCSAASLAQSRIS